MKLLAQTIDSTELTTTQLTTTEVTATPGQEAAAGAAIGIILFSLAITVFLLLCSAKIYTKAERKWWEAIIPIYNVYVLQKIVGRPGWWFLLYLIPFINFVVAIINAVDLAKAFGKGLGTALALIFLPIIMYPIMAFSDSYQYKRGSSPGGPGNMPAASPSGSQGLEGQAVTNIPAAGTAVGAGVGAAQPGEAISQTNPIPTGEPVSSPSEDSSSTPEPSSQPEEVPAEPASEPLEQPPAEPSEETEEPATAPEEPQVPTEPTEPATAPTEEEDPNNPSPTSLG